MAIASEDNTVLPIDFSTTLSGSAQSPLATYYPAAPASGTFPQKGIGLAGSNPYRTFLMFQCQTKPITYSFTNASPNDPASAMSAGCYYLAAGVMSPVWPNGATPGGPLYINGGAGASSAPITIQEC
jgi:hypothetical protein